MSSSTKLVSEVLPTTSGEWRKSMKAEALAGHTIHGLKSELDRDYKSGSKMDNKQFLLLKTLWKQNPTNQFTAIDWVGKDYWQKAAAMLDDFTDWNRYCDVLKSGEMKQGRWHPKEVGKFTPVLKQQIEMEEIDPSTTAEVQKVVMTPPRTPSIAQRVAMGDTRRPVAVMRAPLSNDFDDSFNSEVEDPRHSRESSGERSYATTISDESAHGDPVRTQKAARDEQIVNMCQVLLLQGIIEEFKDIPAGVTIERKAFQFADNLFKAITDGYIRDLRTGTIIAILETKAMRRNNNRHPICRQEAAEMACWIISDPENLGAKRRPDGTYQRLLLAQDRHQLWIILAVYDDAYIKYLQNKEVQKDAESFLVMHEYGPFSLKSPTNLKLFARFILAFSVEGTRPPQYSTPVTSKSGKAAETYHDDSDDSINQGVGHLTIGHPRDDDSDPFDSPSTHSTAQEARRHAQNTVPVSRVVSDDPPSPTPLASSSSVTGGRNRQGHAVQPTSKTPSNKPLDTENPKRGDRTKTTESKDRKKDKVEPKDNKGGSSKDSKDRGRGTRPPKR